MSKNKEGNIGLITKILLFLYLVIEMSAKVVELEYEGVQWFAFSVLNVGGLLFIYSQKSVLKPFEIHKKGKQLFVLFLSLLVISIISVTKSINISESVVHLSRLLNTIAAVYVFYILVRNQPKVFFEFVAKVFVVLLLAHSITTLKYFLGNYSEPRTVSFYKGFLHYFGNINFFTASLIIKIPFVIYLFLRGKTIWKFVSSIVLLTGILSLMYSGSRTAILSLTIIIFFTVFYLLFGVKGERKIGQISYIFLVPFLAFFIFANTNKLHKNELNSFGSIFSWASNDYKKNDKFRKENRKFFETKVEIKNNKSKIRKLIDKTGRGGIWPWAVEIFKENPILGVGYGNYKVDPKESYFKNKKVSSGNYSISIRVHNDFLEKYVETGIVGGTLYVLIFVFIFILMIKNFKNNKMRDLIFFLFLCGIAYTLDAFFNFPSERLPNHLYFILVIAFVLAIDINKSKEEDTEDKTSEVKNIFYYSVVTLMIISAGLNYMVYNSYIENTIFKNQKEFKKRKVELTYQGLKNRIYSFPDLDQDGTKMGYYLASYASLEKKYDLALKTINNHLDSDESAQNLILRKLKGNILLKVYKNLDSAEYSLRQNFEKFPAYKNNYKMLKNIYKAAKDTVKYEKILNTYLSSNTSDYSEWLEKAQYYYNKEKSIKRGVSIIDTALAYNKNSIHLATAKKKFLENVKVNSYYKSADSKIKYSKAIKLYSKGKFKEAVDIFYSIIKKNPEDFYAIQHIGITELYLKNYKTAIKFLTQTILEKRFKDGKAEYCRALCYEALGEKDKAKKDFNAAREKKYPLAMKLPESKYK